MSAHEPDRSDARPRFWRSLEELAGSPDVAERLRREFPEHADVLDDPAGRREFLRLMGASLALAGATACTRQPKEEIVPYSVPPEEMVPGKPLFFATALTLDGVAQGVLVETHMGRPTKVEGNPSHPLSLGSTDAFAQAAILDLYDPDRSRTPRLGGEERSWTAALEALRAIARDQRASKGAGLRILTGTLTSPTLAALLREILAQMPEARWHQYSSASRDNVRLGGRIALGRFVETRWRIAATDVILALDSDFLTHGPAHLLHAREFAQRRRPDLSRAAMNRLYAVESTPTLTGAAADHRLALRPAEIEPFARAVAARLGLPVGTPAAFGPGTPHARWVEAVARDLRTHAGASLVIVGEGQPASLHALGHGLNHHLGNAGRTLGYTEPIEAEPTGEIESLRELVRDMAAGRVQTLLILDGNPVYTAPADLAFGRRLEKVPRSVHLGPYQDETAALCRWHLPQAHELEAWGDARAADGTVTVQQPLIAPLYDGRSPIEVLTILAGGAERSGRDVVRDHWRSQRGEVDFERFWRRTLHDGVMEGTTLMPFDAPLRSGDWAGAAARASEPAGIDAVFRADPCVHDGRFANNAWLQELPKPLTKITWDNAALLGPATARELGIASGDVVQLTLRARSTRAPVWIVPGHTEGVVTLPLGYGRTRSGRVGTEVGFDAGVLRTSDGLWFGSGLTIARTGETRRLACTQDHWSMEGRDIIRVATPDGTGHAARGAAPAHAPDTPPSLYPPWRSAGHAWGMAIDLSACIGCNACVVACQSENNIPVVGREQVGRGREMHWIRVDRYYEGPPESPRAFHQPVPCMQCENAPCEPVCPVAATTHSDEGLNDQVYNRCVGTRYCSNNCPYKVRRFNFLLYQDWNTPSLMALRNPDVTVRSRGIMEKCTYCVQRINQARIAASNEGREMRDGDIRTACQAVCPSQAITFGDVNDPKSVVSLWKAQARNYGLLAELGTRPRTTYLAVLRNPNPELAAPPEREGSGHA